MSIRQIFPQLTEAEENLGRKVDLSLYTPEEINSVKKDPRQ